jgi:hypothetical protein
MWLRIFRISPGSVMNAISRMSTAHPGGTKRQKGIDPRPVRTILTHLGEPLEPPLVSPPADAAIGGDAVILAVPFRC